MKKNMYSIGLNEQMPEASKVYSQMPEASKVYSKIGFKLNKTQKGSQVYRNHTGHISSTPSGSHTTLQILSINLQPILGWFGSASRIIAASDKIWKLKP